jgi:tRNA(Ile)-lysidine synthase
VRTGSGTISVVHKLAERLLTTIRKQDSIRAGDRVAAAVSGGSDSVALLCLLLELRAELGIVVSVAHVNHKLRGAESEEDEQFVIELARQHNLELHTFDAPVDRTAGSGIEAAARALRYSFFRRLTRERGLARITTKVATAHTLDDQAETVLLRTFRGTGIRGLSGIHPRIVFEEQGRAFGEVVRPLLGFRRAVLLEFLRDRGQSWREDSSNRDVGFLRNRVRHRLMPMIQEEFGEAALEHMAELAEIARAEEEHWECGHPEIAPPLPALEKAPHHSAAPPAKLKPGPFKGSSNKAKSNPERSPKSLTRQPVSLPVRQLLALPLAARRRLVRAWLEANAPDLGISFRLIEEALELAGGSTETRSANRAATNKSSAGRKVEMPSGWNLRRGRQALLLESEASAGRQPPTDYQYVLAVPGAVEVPELGACIEARVVDAAAVPEDERGHLLNLELMPDIISIRNWRPGDRYWPAHTSAETKVKELLSDRHATGAQKKLWPVAAAEGCGLIWMRGFAVPAALRAPAGASQAIWIQQIAGMM